MDRVDKLLTIVTRAYKRPDSLWRNIESVGRITPQHLVQQVLLVDQVGIGIPETYRRLRSLDVEGRWVYILDDDDYLSMPDYFMKTIMRAEVAGHDMVVVRMRHGDRVLPVQQQRAMPKSGEAGVSSIACRKDVWDVAKLSFGERYDGDIDYVQKAWTISKNILHIDTVVSVSEIAHHGLPEDDA